MGAITRNSRARMLALLSIASLLGACATQYGQQGFTGGYTDEKIDDTHYRVKFHGNGYASSDRVWAFWMYRCAELTVEKGHTHFSLQKPAEPSQVSWHLDKPAAPGMRHATYRPDEGGQGGMIKTAGAPIFIYVPGQTITTYSSDAVVGLHRTPLPEGVAVLHAQTVLELLNPYVKSDGKAALIARRELIDKAGSMVRPQIGYTFGGVL